jgi:hypothetical protein
MHTFVKVLSLIQSVLCWMDTCPKNLGRSWNISAKVFAPSRCDYGIHIETDLDNFGPTVAQHWPTVLPRWPRSWVLGPRVLPRFSKIGPKSTLATEEPAIDSYRVECQWHEYRVPGSGMHNATLTVGITCARLLPYTKWRIHSSI